MGSDAKGEGPLTILGLCDLLQQMLMENQMQDLPIYYMDEAEGSLEAYDKYIPSVMELPGTSIRVVVI